MRVAIIGSGFCGMSATFRVQKPAMRQPYLKEMRTRWLGGYIQVGGQELENFITTDWVLTKKFLALRELGYGEKLKFKTSKVGIYYANKNYGFPHL